MPIRAVVVQLALAAAVAVLVFLLGVGAAQAGLLRAGWPGPMLPGLALAFAAAAGIGLAVGWSRRQVLARERAARAAAEARIEHLRRRDALTGLLNRTAFRQHLEQLMDGARPSERMLAVLALDLVAFKSINETLGHAAGDLLLRHAGARLLASLRETDLLARMGADEFAIVQVGFGRPQAAAALCERLLETLEEPFDLFGRATYVSAAIGVALHPGDGHDPDALLRHAGIALQRAKQAGGKSFRFFEAGMDAEVRERKALEQDLHQALARHELELDYQPQIDVLTRRIVGVEALLRWRHPTRGRVPPDVFIPLAEDNGMIVPIGAWVLAQACAQAARWHAAGARELRLSVNLSPVQFRGPDLVRLVAGTLAQAGLPPALLELEITERVLMEHTQANLASLRELAALGVKISIDDFGVGHSSLAYLQRFPFDQIKVDRFFVSQLEHDRSAAAIVRAALALGEDLGIGTIAEGVETEGQLQLLRAEGCRVVQGYYFSPPVSVPEIDAMLAAAPARAGPGSADAAPEGSISAA